jgi:hypothetical protein
MKINFLAFIVVIFIAFSIKGHAETNLGLFAGFSSPNNEFNNVSNAIKTKNTNYEDIIQEGMATGYHVGAKLRYSISEKFFFTASASLHKFPESNIDVPNQSGSDTLRLTMTSNVIPLTVGVNYYLFKSVVGLYASGELSYNYFYNSIDVPYKDIPITIDESPKYNRVGFGLGVGADLDIVVTTINLEMKYNLANFIGKVSGEFDKHYLSISLGVFF